MGGVPWWAVVEIAGTELANFDSLTAEQVARAARRSAETPRQIANAHTIFNVANTLIFIWFTGWFAKLIMRILPDLPGPVRVAGTAAQQRDTWTADMDVEAPGGASVAAFQEAGGTVTGEHGVGMEKINQMCVQFNSLELQQFHAVKAAFDPQGLLNPGKAVPTLHRCAEFGAMHVHNGELPFPELDRF